MRVSRIACLSLSLIVGCAVAGNTTGNAVNGATHQSGSAGLLCAGLLGSGILNEVFTVAPVSALHRGDPNDAIQFAPIWSDSHQATVGNTQPAEPVKSRPAVATVKLPIAFSEADREQFVAAGWKPRKEAGATAVTYCLASPTTQGMICVTAAP